VKKIIIALVLLLITLSGCSTAEKKAVYFRRDGDPVLADSELKKFPEIKVVKRFSELEKNLRNPLGIWIDKNVLDDIPRDWLKQSPQKDYPVIVLGYNKPIDVFGTLLPVDFPWPYNPQLSRENLPPGFSAWKQTGADMGIIKGYDQIEVPKLLEVTESLLNNKVPQD